MLLRQSRPHTGGPIGAVALFRRGWLAAALLVAIAACAGGKAKVPPSPVAPPEGLLHGSWRAEEISGEHVVGAGQPTLRFNADGRAGGSGGCNSYTGPVSIDGDAMTFGRLASTQKACLPALLDQEQKFFIALAGARSYSLDGGQLTLRDAAGRPLVLLIRFG